MFWYFNLWNMESVNSMWDDPGIILRAFILEEFPVLCFPILQGGGVFNFKKNKYWFRYFRIYISTKHCSDNLSVSSSWSLIVLFPNTIYLVLFTVILIFTHSAQSLLNLLDTFSAATNDTFLLIMWETKTPNRQIFNHLNKQNYCFFFVHNLTVKCSSSQQKLFIHQMSLLRWAAGLCFPSTAEEFPT